MKQLLLLFIFAVSGCITAKGNAAPILDAESLSILKYPSKYIGESVKVCGYQINADLVDSIDSQSKTPINGIGLESDDLIPKTEYGLISCFTGKVIYTGCESDPKVFCFGPSFDYSLKNARRAGLSQ